MAHRELELTLLSARDLKSVNLFTRMDVYAVASISGDPMTRQCTPTDTSGGRNPSWNATLRFSVPPSAAAATASGGGWLHVLLRSERALGDRDIGEVVIPIAELLAGAEGTGPQPSRLASYQVHTMQRGEPRGVLNVSYRLGPVVAPVVERNDSKAATVGYPVLQQPFKPQNPATPQQQQYQYYDGYAAAQKPIKPQNPAPQQQQYQYYEGYAPAQKPIKPQNPAPQQQPYQYNPQHDGYAPPPQSYKPQNPAPPQQPYQYHDGYAPPSQPFKPQNPASPQPYKPGNQAPQQQPYQYHDAYASPQRFKPQNPASPQPYHSPRDTYDPPPQKPYHPPRESYAPSPRHEEAAAVSPANGRSNGYGPTNYYMGPHTQIILGSGVSTTPTTPARSNTMPAKTEDGPTRPKPTYTPTQPITSPAKADHAWPKAASPQQQHKDTTTPAWPNASPKKPDLSTQPQPGTKNSAPAHQPITKTDHSSWPKASPQRNQDSPAWPKASLAKPDDRSTTRPQQPDTKVVERVHTQTKVGSGKPDHSTRPQAVEQQKSTQVSVTKTNGSQAGGDYARTLSNSQPAKADSTRPNEVYANTRSNSTPAKADQHQSGHKAVLQHERVHSLPTAAAR